MKKNVFCLITVFAALFAAVSCDKKDDDKTDQVWKLANEQAFNAVKNNPAYTEFKSPGNEGSIYYRVLKKGTGTKQIFYTSTATVYSKGWFAADSKEYGIAKGMVFQKWLAEDGIPAELKVSELVSKKNGLTVSLKGIQAALQKMKQGDKWEIWIPYQLGGGKSKASALTIGSAPLHLIPAYSTLVFEIEVAEVIQ